METGILISTIRDSGEHNGPSEHLPSLFEIILVDQIDAMLKPVFHHGIIAVHDSLPLSLQSFASLLRARWEDLYNTLVIVLQWIFIRKRNATIAESIYGLVRRSLGDGDQALDGAGRVNLRSSSPQRRWQQDMGIWFVAVLPRVVDSMKRACKDIRTYSRQQRRAQEMQAAQAQSEAEELEGGRTADSGGGDGAASRAVSSLWSVQRLNRRVLRGVHCVTSAATAAINLIGEATAEAFPYAAAGAKLWVVSQKVRYLFGHTAYSHPFFAMIGIALVRRDVRKHGGDAPAASASGAASGTPRQVPLMGRREHDTNWQLATLVVAILSVRGVQWLMQRQDALASTGRRARVAAAASGSAPGPPALEVPSPPPRPPIRSGGAGAVSAPADGTCPLCRSAQRSPAVSTGGYVFCYNCLVQSIRAEVKHGQCPVCPVTGIPCTEEDIILVH